jgi:protein arginine N-methyltransferase 5
MPKLLGYLFPLFSRYDFTCFPIIHPRFKREFINGKSKERPGAFTRSDLILAGSGK